MKKRWKNAAVSVLLAASMISNLCVMDLPVMAQDGEPDVTEMVLDGETVYVQDDATLDLTDLPEADDDYDLSMEVPLDDYETSVSPVSDGGEPAVEEPEIAVNAGDSGDQYLEEVVVGSITGEEETAIGEIDESDDLYTNTEEPEEAELGSIDWNQGTSDGEITEGDANSPVQSGQEAEDDLTVGASEPRISASNTNISLSVGQSVRIIVSVSGVSGSYYATVSSLNKEITPAGFLEGERWRNQTIGLTIWGGRTGTNLVFLTLRQGGTNKVLASTTVRVKVTGETSLSASKTNVSVQVGSSETVTIKCNDGGLPTTLGGSNSNDKVSSGIWQENKKVESGSALTIPLKFTGLRAGTSVYTIRLARASDGAVLRTVTITVKVTAVPKITAASSVSVEKGKSVRLNVSWSGVEGKCRIACTTSNDNCKAEWGSRSGDTMPLIITGCAGGTTKLTLQLLYWDRDAAFATTYTSVTISVPPAKLTPSKTSLSLEQGEKQTITLTGSNFDGAAEIYHSTVGSSAKASYGQSSGCTIPFIITGEKTGTTTFFVYLRDSKTKQLLASTKITVDVKVAAQFKVSVSSMTLKAGGNQRIVFSHTGTQGNYNICIQHPRCVTTSWDDNWSGNSLGMTVYGISAGSGNISATLVRASDGGVVASVSVAVTVKTSDPAVTVSPLLTTLNANSAETKDVSVGYGNPPQGACLMFAFSKAGIVKGEWINTGTMSVRLTAAGSGTTTMTVYMMDGQLKTVYAKASSTIVVSGEGISNYSYSFINSKGSYYEFPGFGYPEDYHIPLASFQLMFGDTPLARQYYEAEGNWGGNCFGMATTSGMLATSSGVNVKNFRSGASKPYDLKVSDYNSALGINLTRFVEAMQISQCATIMKSLRKGWGDVNALVKQVKSGRPTIVNVYGWIGEYDGDGKKAQTGHAVLAYGISTTGKLTDYINVYDPNAPDEVRKIAISKNSAGVYTSWKFDINGHAIGTGLDLNAISYVTYSDYINLWNRRGNLGDVSYNLLVANSADMNIYDVEDNLVAQVRNGKLSTSNESIFEPSVIDASVGGAYMLYLPTRYYRIENLDEELELFQASMANVELGAWVTTSGDAIDFAVEDTNDLNQVMLSVDAGEIYQIELMSSKEGDPESIQVNGIGDGSDVCVMTENGTLNTEGTTNAMVNADGEIVNGFAIHAEASSGGTVFPSGDVPVISGGTQTFRMIPDKNYYVKDILVDGKSVGAAESYTFSGVKADRSIKVIFAHDHAWGAWKTTKDATVLSAGEQTRTCSICNATEKKSVAILKPTYKLSASSLTLKVGQSTKKLTISGLEKGDSVVKWTSSNKKIVTVNNSGVIKGKKKGNATITITLASGAAIKVKVKVQKKEVATTAITGLPKKVTVKKGKKITLKPKLKPITSVEKITYKSSNKKVATVTSKGVIKGRKAGTVKITVKAGKKKFTVTVKVSK